MSLSLLLQAGKNRLAAWIWLEEISKCPCCPQKWWPHPVPPPGHAHTSRPKRHSHSCHTLILEGDKGHVKPLQRDAVAFSIELICELLLQFPIVLLSIHLWEQRGLGHGQATVLPAVLPTLGPRCLQPNSLLPTCSKPQKRQQKIRAQGWVLIMIFPSFCALVVK